MGESSVYYVPESQDLWSGRGDELADRLWERGVFLGTPAITERLQKIRSQGGEFPACELDIDHKFGGMGVTDEAECLPVPNCLYQITCPACDVDVSDLTYKSWATESSLSLKERTVVCPSCKSEFATMNLQYGEPMSFARFYVWVSDCEKANWDHRFRSTLEQIVGPCLEYWEWAT